MNQPPLPPTSDNTVSHVRTSYIGCSLPLTPLPSENEMDGFVAEGVFVEFFCSPLDAVVPPSNRPSDSTTRKKRGGFINHGRNHALDIAE